MSYINETDRSRLVTVENHTLNENGRFEVTLSVEHVDVLKALRKANESLVPQEIDGGDYTDEQKKVWVGALEALGRYADDYYDQVNYKEPLRVGDYKAEVSGSGSHVSVGCQTIPFEQVKALYDAMREAQS